MEIGLFQLENLLVTRTQFCFLDLRSKVIPIPELEDVLSHSTPVTAANALEHLKRDQVALTSPIVLLCESGKTSEKLAHSLEAAGFQNIYTVARGTEGLLSEL